MIDLPIIFLLVKFVSFISESNGTEQKPKEKHITMKIKHLFFFFKKTLPLGFGIASKNKHK